jgi:hypothetical protein
MGLVLPSVLGSLSGGLLLGATLDGLGAVSFAVVSAKRGD